METDYCYKGGRMSAQQYLPKHPILFCQTYSSFQDRAFNAKGYETFLMGPSRFAVMDRKSNRDTVILIDAASATEAVQKALRHAQGCTTD